MRKIAVAFLFCLVSSIANAQEVFQLNKPMTCSKVQNLINYVTVDYGEKLTWIGIEDSTGTYIALYKNSETGTWSMIQYDSVTGCFLGHGVQGSAT